MSQRRLTKIIPTNTKFCKLQRGNHRSLHWSAVRPAVYHPVYIWHLMINEQRSKPTTPDSAKIAHYSTFRGNWHCCGRSNGNKYFQLLHWFTEVLRKRLYIFKNYDMMRTPENRSAIAHVTPETKTKLHLAETLAMRMGNRLGVLNAVRMWNPFPQAGQSKGILWRGWGDFYIHVKKKHGIIQRKSNKSE